MTRSAKIFAIHPGEILKTEFMEPMGLSAYALAKALAFPGIYDVVRSERAISADTAIRLGKYFGLPAQFWLNLQNDYDLRRAVSSGVGKGIKPWKTVRPPASKRRVPAKWKGKISYTSDAFSPLTHEERRRLGFE